MTKYKCDVCNKFKYDDEIGMPEIARLIKCPNNLS